MQVGALEGRIGFLEGFDGRTKSVRSQVDLRWRVVPNAEAFRG